MPLEIRFIEQKNTLLLIAAPTHFSGIMNPTNHYDFIAKHGEPIRSVYYFSSIFYAGKHRKPGMDNFVGYWGSTHFMGDEHFNELTNFFMSDKDFNKNGEYYTPGRKLADPHYRERHLDLFGPTFSATISNNQMLFPNDVNSSDEARTLDQFRLFRKALFTVKLDAENRFLQSYERAQKAKQVKKAKAQKSERAYTPPKKRSNSYGKFNPQAFR